MHNLHYEDGFVEAISGGAQMALKTVLSQSSRSINEGLVNLGRAIRADDNFDRDANCDRLSFDTGQGGVSIWHF